MKKQICYANFAPRMFSTMMDLILVSILLLPISVWVNKIVIIKKFGALFASKNVDINDMKALQDAMQSIEFAPYSNPGTIIDLMLPMLSVQTLFIMLYFILCWSIWGTTPVKYIMRMRVVDSSDFAKPTLFQSIRRVIGYIFYPIGIWFIFFTTQKQMLHDKMSSIVVIKT